MRTTTALLACAACVPLQAFAEEPYLEVGGLKITRGMSAESIRSGLAEPFRLTCYESGADTDLTACSVSAPDGTRGSVQVTLQAGRVLTASQGYAVPPTAIDAYMVLYKLLLELTGGQDTCAVIRVSEGPPPQFAIALPEKYVAAFLHVRDQGQVGLNVGLRQNPTPQIQLTDCWPTAAAKGS